MFASIFLTQMPAHTDLVNGDCEEIQSSCPWTQIGCPKTKVCKCLTLLQLGGDRALNGPTLRKKMTLIAFFWSRHLRSCHYFALPEGYQTYLFVGVCGGGGTGWG